MKAKHHHVILNLGGGDKQTLNPKNIKTSSSQSKKSHLKIFTPLIASSLALTLSVSTAVANPQILAGEKGSEQDITKQLTTLEWETVDGFLTPKIENGSRIENLNFTFVGMILNSQAASLPLEVNSSGTTYNVEISTQKIPSLSGFNPLPSFQIISDQAISLGNNGKGTLKIDLGSEKFDSSGPSASSTTRSFLLNLSKVTSPIALKGNLEVISGAANQDPENPNITFDAQFGGDVEGNISVKDLNSNINQGQKITFDFQKNASLKGNFSANVGTKILKFNQGNVTGDIIHGNRDSNNKAKGASSLQVLFAQENAQIGGQLIAYTDDKSIHATTTIKAPSLSIGGSIEASNSQVSLELDHGENTIKGDIKFVGKVPNTGKNATVKFDIPNEAKLSITGSINMNDGNNTLTILAPKTDLSIGNYFSDSAGPTVPDEISINAKSLQIKGKKEVLGENQSLYLEASQASFTLNGGNSSIAHNIFLRDSKLNFNLNGGETSIGGDLKIDEKKQGQINFTLNDAAILTLNGAENQFSNLTATNADNQLIINNGLTKNEITTLTLGSDQESAQDHSLSISTVKNLRIENVKVADQKTGTLSFANNTGEIKISSLILKNGNTLKLNNQSQRQNLTITRLVSSGASTLDLQSGQATIMEEVNATGGTDNHLIIGENATLTLNKGFISNQGANRFTISGNLIIGNLIGSENTLSTTDGGSITEFNIKSTSSFGFDKIYKALEAKNGGKNIINSEKTLRLQGTIIADSGSNEITLSGKNNYIEKEIKAQTNGVNSFSLTHGADLTINAEVSQLSGGANNFNLEGASSLTLLNKSSINEMTLQAKSQLFAEDQVTIAKFTSSNSSATFKGEATINELSMQNTKIILKDSAKSLKIGTLALQSGKQGEIDLAASDDFSTGKDRSSFRLLTIGSKNQGGITGVGNDPIQIEFKTFINPSIQTSATLGEEQASTANDQYGYAYSDRIIIHNFNKTPALTDRVLKASLKLYGATDTNRKKRDFENITYKDGGTEVKGNIAIATIETNKSGSGSPFGITKLSQDEIRKQGAITLEETPSLQGFQVIDAKLKAVFTDENGKTNVNDKKYITYFVEKTSIKSHIGLEEVLPSLALSSTDLYLANFNSLNKRMGELRDNAHSQGVWARIFGGEQSNDLGLKGKTNYITFQGGYDYAFGFDGANNYLGFALSYSFSNLSSSLSTQEDAGASLKINDLKSGLFEAAIYNSYVQDDGWYNDTIMKLGYLTNTADIGVVGSATSGSNKGDISSFTFTLSNEFGYRIKLGSTKEWYIDPQLELGIGYINGDQFDLKDNNGIINLNGNMKSLFNLRGRVGATFGYDFKNFTQEKDLKAGLYLGLFGEMDYFNGGDSEAKMPDVIKGSFLDFDKRLVLNVGTNLTVKDNTRIYMDFESSFLGKIKTNYKINAGVRYSFGENTGYKPTHAVQNDESSENKAPLKIQDKEEKEQSKESGE